MSNNKLILDRSVLLPGIEIENSLSNLLNENANNDNSENSSAFDNIKKIFSFSNKNKDDLSKIETDSNISIIKTDTTISKIYNAYNENKFMMFTSNMRDDYFYNIIYIIIFLTFLNFFIVTYFYFTSLIKSNINKSNCGTGTLEAETFRHIFLQDNTQDKTRDVYFFVIIIFTLYILHLLFSNDFETSNLINSDEKYPRTFFIALVFTILLAVYLFGIFSKLDSWKKDKLLHPNFNYKVASSIIFGVYIFIFILAIVSINIYNKNIVNTNFSHLIFLGLILLYLYNSILISSLNLYNFTIFGTVGSNDDGATYGLTIVAFLIFILAPIIPIFTSTDKLYLKYLVYYFIFLFLINLYFVYFNNKDKINTGLEYFQLYSNTEDTSKDGRSNNLYKYLNIVNCIFVLLILCILIFLNIVYSDDIKTFKLFNIVNLIITFIISSYITGIIYIIYQFNYPVQRTAMEYKKILYDINNEISRICSYEPNMTTFNHKNILKLTYDTYENLNTELLSLYREDDYDNNIKIIKSLLKSKYANYIDYSDSYIQLLYEEYILKVIELIRSINQVNINFTPEKSTTPDSVVSVSENTMPTIFNSNYIEKNGPAYKFNSSALNNFKLFVYNQFINKLNSQNLDTFQNKDFVIKHFDYYNFTTNNLENIDIKININSKTRNINLDNLNVKKYENSTIQQIKKNFKYVTGKPGVIIKYNKINSLNNTVENNILHWVQLPTKAKDDGIAWITYNLFQEYKNFEEYKSNLKYLIEKFKPPSDSIDVSTVTEKTVTEKETKIINNFFISLFNNNLVLTSNLITTDLKDSINIFFNVNPDDIEKEITEFITFLKKHFVFKPKEKYVVFSKDTESFKSIQKDQKSLKDFYNGNIKINKDTLFIKGNDKGNYTHYILKPEIFDEIKSKFNDDNMNYLIVIDDHYYININGINTNFDLNKLSSENTFYCIREHSINDNGMNIIEESINERNLLTMPASNYICSYIDYGANANEVMNIKRFKENYIEDNTEHYINNIINNRIDIIKNKYDLIHSIVNKELPENKFYILLIILIILSIIILVVLFSIIKKYITGDVYTPQMYMLGIIGIFLTVFIFGEVIFSRIK